MLVALLTGLVSPPQTVQRTDEGTVRYLDNGIVRLGFDLGKGGAITYLAKANGPNMVNNHDLGRQIQMSYYSGPNPYEPNGKKPLPFWAGLGWNPIQSGDVYGNRSRILASKVDRTKAYIKCIPMHWPLENVPGECVFESWIELKGNTVSLRQRIVNDRPDRTQYSARQQELPAVYVNGPWHRLVTYTGDRPFSGDATVEIPKKPWDEAGPWTPFFATESWAALVDDRGNGLGIWSPGTFTMLGGFVGEPGKGGTNDAPTGYVAPIRTEVLDHNGMLESRCTLVLGSVDEIRSFVSRQPRPKARPHWSFSRSREGWFFVNAKDEGWPIRGDLDVRLEKPDPQIISPAAMWRADDAPVLVIDAALSGVQDQAELFWTRTDARNFSPDRRVRVNLIGDGKRRRTRVRLATHPEYRGTLTGIRLDPVLNGIPGGRLKLYGVYFDNDR